MGQVIESCNLKCCENENNSLDKKKTYLSQNSEDSDDDYENQYKQIEYSRYYCVTETPKTSIDFPVKIKNLFFQHFS